MFTGIIKAKGTVSAIERRGGDVRLTVSSDEMPFSDYETGESIAVNGVCLTAVELRADSFDTDVSIETLDVTALGQLGIGDAVNLEPSLSLGDRLGGHLVSGHVDCVGKVVQRETDARSIRLAIEIRSEYARYVARKGSVTVDGVSLTVNEVRGSVFDVNIIPHTAQATIIGDYVTGSTVNIEVDLLARYIERLLAKDSDGLSMEFLREHGYG
ncbi:MAG: riboflavin synthase [Gammaproteobacteria bacterium]|nr:riboflavin synthase [Gammaproteobacteria bacterium]MDH3433901.1 riboflavin synthase [Gammaproteobacteria bacterium]